MLFTNTLKMLVLVEPCSGVTLLIDTTVTPVAPKPLAAVAVAAAKSAVRSTVLAPIALSFTIAVSLLAGLKTLVAVTVAVKPGPPLLPVAPLVGRLAFTITVKTPPAATGPVSRMPSPFVSSRGVVPSALNNWKVVPAGKLLVPVEMFRVSDPLPRFQAYAVNVTIAPWAALATVSGSPVPLTELEDEPFNTTLPDCTTVYSTLLVLVAGWTDVE